MREVIYIGPCPYDEDAAQSVDQDFAKMNSLECRVFKDQILRKYPKVAKLQDLGRLDVKIKAERGHDYGTYREVVIVVDPTDEAALDAALSVESDTKGALARWDRASREKLNTKSESGLYESIFSGGMTYDEIALDMKSRAKSELEAGGKIKYDPRFPTLEIERSDGEVYFYQDYQVDDLVSEYESDPVHEYIDFEDYILAKSQNW